MKRQIANVIGVFGLLLMAACANAQTLKAKVPFDFVADKTTLSAGDYSIAGISGGNPNLLVIRNESVGGGMIVLANPAASADPSSDSRLVFHRYGDTYFLSQIWSAGNRSGRQLKVSSREKEMASNIRSSEDVIVLASLR